MTSEDEASHRLSLQFLKHKYPWTAWTAPIHVQRAEGPGGFACRICIANAGLNYDSPLYATAQDCVSHIMESHKLAES